MKPTNNVKRMGKPLLVKALSKKLDIGYDVAEDVFNAIIETLVDGINEYDKVDLCGLVTFEKRHRNERETILNGEVFKVESGVYVKAKIHNEFNKLGQDGRYTEEQYYKITNRYKRK